MERLLRQSSPECNIVLLLEHFLAFSRVLPHQNLLHDELKEALPTLGCGGDFKQLWKRIDAETTAGRAKLVTMHHSENFVRHGHCFGKEVTLLQAFIGLDPLRNELKQHVDVWAHLDDLQEDLRFLVQVRLVGE